MFKPVYVISAPHDQFTYYLYYFSDFYWNLNALVSIEVQTSNKLVVSVCSRLQIKTFNRMVQTFFRVQFKVFFPPILKKLKLTIRFRSTELRGQKLSIDPVALESI